jgi:hypothetical protein
MVIFHEIENNSKITEIEKNNSKITEKWKNNRKKTMK